MGYQRELQFPHSSADHEHALGDLRRRAASSSLEEARLMFRQMRTGKPAEPAAD
jgi:hypothetical protein